MTNKQGYNDRLDESLGARNRGKKTQSMASRRKESKGTEKASGNRAYAAVSTMDSSRKTSKAKPQRVVNLGAGGPVTRSSGKSANSSNTNEHKLIAMGIKVPQGTTPVRMRGGGMAASKKMKSGTGPVRMRGGGMVASKKMKRGKGPRGRA
tara:strand:- start:59 stop:511 length:453 start_codon:yes stop_codon:yes gene_type:complete